MFWTLHPQRKSLEKSLEKIQYRPACVTYSGHSETELISAWSIGGPASFARFGS